MKYDWYYEMSGCRNEPDLTENEVLIQVPFIGTYEMLDRLIDDECEHEAEYLKEYPQEGYENGFNASFDMISFLKDYVGEISDICELPSLKFQYLSSPREYNFSTDRLICSVDKNELWKLYEQVNEKFYHNEVHEATRRRDGYIPYFIETDFYYESVDDFGDNSARLGLILDAELNAWLNVHAGGYNEDLLNTFELFLQSDCYEKLNEYIHF